MKNLHEIPGFEGYKISDEGVVYSFKRKQNAKKLSLNKTKDGHLRVGLYVNDKVTHFGCHRLMAFVKCGKKLSSDKIVRHLDGNPSNNTFENLAIGTTAENVRDRCRHGNTVMGEKSQKTLHSDAKCLKIIKFINKGYRNIEIAEKFDVNPSFVCNLKKRNTRKYLFKNLKENSK